MNTLSNKEKNSKETRAAFQFCPRMDKDVDTHQTLAECIGANECFSDDPCPLSDHFKESPISTQQASNSFPKI